MKKLENKGNVNAPSVDWPFGEVRDKTLLVPGTKWDVEMMSDIIQFFSKMFDVSGIAANGLLDNELNGFQLFQAFQLFAGPWKTVVGELGPWDMDTTVNIQIPHGLSDPLKVRSIDFVIFSDAGAVFPHTQGGVNGATWGVFGANITFGRTNGGAFDDPGFSNAIANRGFYIMKHDDA